MVDIHLRLARRRRAHAADGRQWWHAELRLVEPRRRGRHAQRHRERRARRPTGSVFSNEKRLRRAVHLDTDALSGRHGNNSRDRRRQTAKLVKSNETISTMDTTCITVQLIYRPSVRASGAPAVRSAAPAWVRMHVDGNHERSRHERASKRLSVAGGRRRQQSRRIPPRLVGTVYVKMRRHPLTTHVVVTRRPVMEKTKFFCLRASLHTGCGLHHHSTERNPIYYFFEGYAILYMNIYPPAARQRW